MNFHYVDTTVILDSNKKELAININEILPQDESCRIDCNFPGCDSEIIIVKRNSQYYRTIWSRDSIFENRAAKLSDDGTFVCMVGNNMSENNFTLIIHRKSILLGFWDLCSPFYFIPFFQKISVAAHTSWQSWVYRYKLVYDRLLKRWHDLTIICKRLT